MVVSAQVWKLFKRINEYSKPFYTVNRLLELQVSMEEEYRLGCRYRLAVVLFRVTAPA
jgi:hypothetical protein